MAKKNITLKDNDGNQLFPRTKAELVEGLELETVEMTYNISEGEVLNPTKTGAQVAALLSQNKLVMAKVNIINGSTLLGSTYMLCKIQMAQGGLVLVAMEFNLVESTMPLIVSPSEDGSEWGSWVVNG